MHVLYVSSNCLSPQSCQGESSMAAVLALVGWPRYPQQWTLWPQPCLGSNSQPLFWVYVNSTLAYPYLDLKDICLEEVLAL